MNEKKKISFKEKTRLRNEKIKARNENIRLTIKRRNDKVRLAAIERRKIIRQTAGKLHKSIKLSTSKILLYLLLFAAQLAILVYGFTVLIKIFDIGYLLIAAKILAIIFVIYIINSDIANEYKIIWIMVVVFFDFIGIFIYLIFGRKKMPKRKVRKYLERTEDVSAKCVQDEIVMQRAQEEDSFVAGAARGIASACKLPLLLANDYEYFDIGEKYFERLKEELSKAERFIFLEFFIISKGQMWDELFAILKEKALKGVDVRIIYDDLGSVTVLPPKFGKNCFDVNIKLYCYNRLRPILDVAQNNRTHRKIVVIDGLCAFTGGLNIGDEYINRKERFGHWKDTGVMIKGAAVQNFTLMFLSAWMAKFGKEDIDGFFVNPPIISEEAHVPVLNQSAENAEIQILNKKDEVFCVPFCDTPINRRTVCEDLYLNIIYNAKQYVYINTPYLIIDERMTAALTYAANSGVDVRIIVPHIPDKKYVFALTRAFYTPLVLAGVKIYEYKPGFIHAKSIVSDDKHCVIGSSNMDFRSFYLHNEVNIFMYKGICKDMRADYEVTCERSIFITREAVGNVKILRRLGRSVLRLLAPLM